MTDYVLQQVVNALSAGSLYALMAVGLAMVFGILRLINFAHGDVMMIAAYIAFFCLGAGLPLLVAMPIMVVGTIVVGLLMERVAYRPLRGAPGGRAAADARSPSARSSRTATLLTTRLAGRPDADRLPQPRSRSAASSRSARSRSPRSTSRSFLVGHRAARAADRCS